MSSDDGSGWFWSDAACLEASSVESGEVLPNRSKRLASFQRINAQYKGDFLKDWTDETQRDSDETLEYALSKW